MLVRRERFAAPAGALGDSVVRILIATKFPENVGVIVGISDLLRQDLQIGERYIIRMFIHSDCGDRTHSLPVVPDMVFKVIE